MKERRLLVTGGSGFLGSWIVQLARGDWDVAATFLNNPVRGPGIDWRQLDVQDEAAVTALIGDVRPNVLIHAAALNPGQGSTFEAVNSVGTRNVARAAAHFGARLIHVSTDVLFDGEKGSKHGGVKLGKGKRSAYVEEDPPSPITPYGRSKARAEQAVRRSDASAVIVRTSLIYGPAATDSSRSLQEAPWQQWDRQTRWVIGDVRTGAPVRLFTDEWRCPMWAERLAAALLELAQCDAVPQLPAGVIHIAGAQPLSRYAFGVRLARFHGVDPGGISPALSSESGLNRPLDCTLDCSRAQALLRTPMPGVDDVLQVGAGS